MQQNQTDISLIPHTISFSSCSLLKTRQTLIGVLSVAGLAYVLAYLSPATVIARQTVLEKGANTIVSGEKFPELRPGDQLPEFELKDYHGKTWSNGDFSEKPTIVFFFGVGCPIVKLQMAEFSKDPDSPIYRDFHWIGINSNQQDSLAEIANFVRFNDLDQLPIAMLKDPGNEIADRFHATRTPEVFLFDATGKLAYRGAVDDRYGYGVQRLEAENKFLLDAMRAVQVGQPVSRSITDPVGCLIGRRLQAKADSEVTYSNQISRIVQQKCLNCHRDGEIAPFALADYHDVSGWAEMIREVTQQRRMPPWHANPEYGHFINDSSLSAEELNLIAAWVDAGAPEGDPSELPQPVDFPLDWKIGQPDVIIPMAKQPFSVPATGVIPYEYFVIDPGFKEDKWVSAAECRIGNRSVVHHIIVALQRNKREALHGVQSEWIVATAPGAMPMILPEGYAKLIPAGSKLVFQMHYTPNGTAQTDLSAVGFRFADPSQVKKIVGTRSAVNDEFVIQPHAENHPVRSQIRLRSDSLILSLFPHMHLRGKSFRYTARFPDGSTEVLLDIPQYDFNWQNSYEFAEPRRLPAGTVIECLAHFDNSSNNWANPNPNETVRWGDQTWEEMMIGYFNMALADQDLQVDHEPKGR